MTTWCLTARPAGLAPVETWGRCAPRSLCGRMEPTKALPEEDQAALCSDLAIAAGFRGASRGLNLHRWPAAVSFNLRLSALLPPPPEAARGSTQGGPG